MLCKIRIPYRRLTKDHLLTLLDRQRAELRRELNRERGRILTQASNLQRVNDIKAALKTGRIKKLFPTECPAAPDMLRTTDEDGSQKMAVNPEARRVAWDEHFQSLYHRHPPNASADRPWMASTASEKMKERTAGDNNFSWPRMATVDTLRVLLIRGNPKPAPGPDGWERWALRRTNDRFLALIIDLLNYTVRTNHFPERVKGNWIVPLPKPKDDLSDLKNWRGIVHANCLFQIITSWFSTDFQAWVWDRGLLAPTQVATQQGVQISDLTAFLEHIDASAALTKTSVLAIKRDHVKGFDYLGEQAYLDSLAFFGVNPLVAQFEKARTTDITLRVRSSDGPGRTTIVTNGQTKQGDPLSPLKYTLVMSMFYHWVLLDRRCAKHLVTLTTITAAHNRYHLPADKHQLKLLSVEAMDDSILFAPSWPALRELVSLSETFQHAYGIETAWDSADKTVCFTLGYRPEAGPQAVTFLDAEGRQHRVPFTDSPHILRTAIADVAATNLEIKDIIDRFSIRRGAGPNGTDFPLSLIRRAVESLLVSKIRSKLRLQPIPITMAREVDQLISRKVTDAIGVRHTLSDILSLPVRNLGFGLPSIVEINGVIAVDRLLRSLNHHIRPFRIAAEIAMANWQCHGNHCAPPLEMIQAPRSPPVGRKRPATEACEGHYSPVSWRVAQEYLRLTDIRIIETDQSHVQSSPPAHIARRAHVTNTPQQRDVARAYQIYPSLFRTGTITSLISGLSSVRPQTLTTQSAIRSLSKIDIPASLTNTDTSVFQSRATRRTAYNRTITRALTCTADSGEQQTYATDGSSIQTPAGRTSSTAALVGPMTASFVITGQMSSSMHGERLGLIAALIATQLGSRSATILTDHLNSVRDVNRVRHPDFRIDTWRGQPGHELYHWLVKAIQHTASDGQVTHVKAHTGQQDLASQLNKRADTEARLAHYSATRMPPLTGWMRPYVAYVPLVGYCPDNWQGQLTAEIKRHTFESQPAKLKARLTQDHGPIPEYFYRKSPSVITTKYQLINRLGQYTCNELTARCEANKSPYCPFCGKRETEAHIFLWCTEYDALRTEAITKAMRFWRNGHSEADEADVRQYLDSHLQTRRDGLRYWMRQIRDPSKLSDFEATVAHHMCIALTSRIAGHRTRKMGKAPPVEPEPDGFQCVIQ